jgi:hypothetical protein
MFLCVAFVSASAASGKIMGEKLRIHRGAVRAAVLGVDGKTLDVVLGEFERTAVASRPRRSRSQHRDRATSFSWAAASARTRVTSPSARNSSGTKQPGCTRANSTGTIVPVWRRFVFLSESGVEPEEFGKFSKGQVK